ncbi:MAG: YkvA family protein [Anaerolineales bacterium]
MEMIERLKKWARYLKQETTALYYAYRDPRTPWYAKGLTIFVVAHTLSPIDLIPDFIPVLGYLDDLLITPLGLALAFKLIPEQVLVDARQKAEAETFEASPLARTGTVIVIATWILGLVVLGAIIFKVLSS